MPEWEYDPEDDIQASDLVKQLRKQLSESQKKNKELDTELGTLRPQVRKNSVASVLSNLGYNTKIAALLPESVEPSKEAVETWLKDYGDVFNLQPTKAEEKPEGDPAKPVEPSAGQVTPINQLVQDQWGRVQSGEAAAGTSTPDIESQQIAQLGRALEFSGGSYDKFLATLKGDLPLPN